MEHNEAGQDKKKKHVWIQEIDFMV